MLYSRLYQYLHQQKAHKHAMRRITITVLRVAARVWTMLYRVQACILFYCMDYFRIIQQSIKTLSCHTMKKKKHKHPLRLTTCWMYLLQLLQYTRKCMDIDGRGCFFKYSAKFSKKAKMTVCSVAIYGRDLMLIKYIRKEHARGR